MFSVEIDRVSVTLNMLRSTPILTQVFSGSDHLAASGYTRWKYSKNSLDTRETISQ